MFDPVHLRTLLEFSARGTITATADALGYTPSAVSQQLAALQREAGTPLTRRAGRVLLLTAAGTALVQSAAAVLDSIEVAHARVDATRSDTHGTVRIAIFQSAALALLPTVLDELAENAPALRVEVTQVEPAQALQDTWAREYDLVVAEEYPHHSAPHYSGLVRHTLVQDRIALCLSNERQEATVTACAKLPWVMEPHGTASRHYAEQACRVAGFEPDVRFETADLQAQLALIEAGHAVAFIPALMLQGAPRQVRVIPGQTEDRRTVFAAVRAASRQEPGVQAVLNALRRASYPWTDQPRPVS